MGQISDAAGQDITINQADYRPSEYQDAEWELIGERRPADAFIPLEVSVLSSDSEYVDPMFADFGGTHHADSPVRWHLPAELAYKAQAVAGAHEPPAEPTQSLTEAQIEALRAEAYAAGRNEALAEAAAKSSEKLSAMQKRIEAILVDVQRQLAEQLRSIETSALNLALEISRKIIDRAVEINPEYIVDVINRSIALAGTASIKTIRISPQDHEFIEVVGVGKSIKGFEEHWQFVPDSTIKAGCVIDTTAGEIDYQLDRAWERIQERAVKIAR